MGKGQSRIIMNPKAVLNQGTKRKRREKQGDLEVQKIRTIEFPW